MGRYDYYRHLSGGFAFDYFGGVGKPEKISFSHYVLLKLLGYRVTRVPRGSDRVRVMVRAALRAGAHRRSLKVLRIKSSGGEEG